jgi:hypothetical protein
LASRQKIRDRFLITVIDEELSAGFGIRLGDEFTILVRQATRFVLQATLFLCFVTRG